MSIVSERLNVLKEYVQKALDHKVTYAALQELRANAKDIEAAYNQTEAHLNALQNVGQLCGEVLQKMDDDTYLLFYLFYFYYMLYYYFIL